MEYLFIYLLQITENAANIAQFFIGLGCVLLVISLMIYGACMSCIYNSTYSKQEKECFEKHIKLCKIIPTIVLIIGLLFSLIPTKQTLLLMGGYYLGKKTVNAVVTDEKIKKIDTIINLELDKRIKDLKSENK